MNLFSKEEEQSTIAVEQPKELTYEEKVNKSWEYLNVTANKVAALPTEVQDNILKLGKVLEGFEMIYIHVIDEGAQVKRSPAKLAAAALEAFEAKQQNSGGAGTGL